MRHVLLALLLVVVVACARQERSGSDVASTDSYEVSSAPPPQMVALRGTPSQTKSTAPAPVPTPARMMVRNANISLIVKDAAEVMTRMTALAESKGGFVAEARQWKEGQAVRGSAALRVPQSELTTTLAALRGLAVRTDSEHITSQDVTEEFADLGAQLRNLQAAETELRELLRTVRQRTQKAVEILEIYNEITKVRGEIERIQGRMNYLSSVSALSTITVQLIPDALAAPVVEPGWQPVATMKAAMRALVNSLKAIADVAIWVLIYIVPLALVFVAAALAARALWLRLRTKGNLTTETPSH